ncbi:MAG: glycosyltransferase family 2 protein [Bacteroidales bacterium]|nr:glycosyltransferase family 2 protein [Bacteroidales bacterium]
MIYIAWFIFFFTILQLLVAFINLTLRPKLMDSPPVFKGLVSVLIPVRNEEHNIHLILNDLIHQDFENIEILVFDDESEDNSAAVISEFTGRDSRIRLISSKGLPAGWLGKMHACHVLSRKAKGEYLLFLDADVRISKNAILKAINCMQKHSLGLLSVFPRQIMKTTGEWLTVPTMNYILLSLLPLILVIFSKHSSLSAANGQFMLFQASLYNTFLPHEKMKANLVEDIAIARLFKKNNIRVACLVGDDTIRCRMYTGFFDAVHGFSKNIIAFFGNSFFTAVLFWLITTAGFAAILCFLPFVVFVIYLTCYVLTRVIISQISRQNTLMNIIFIIPHQIAIGIFIIRAAINTLSKRYLWKGRYL